MADTVERLTAALEQIDAITEEHGHEKTLAGMVGLDSDELDAYARARADRLLQVGQGYLLTGQPLPVVVHALLTSLACESVIVGRWLSRDGLDP
jgi:hypothetical protein